MPRSFLYLGLITFVLSFSSEIFAQGCTSRIDASVLCFAENREQSESLLKSASPDAQGIYKSARAIHADADEISGLPATNPYQLHLRNKCHNERLSEFFGLLVQPCKAAAQNCLNTCPSQGDINFCNRLLTGSLSSETETDARVGKLALARLNHQNAARQSATTEVTLVEANGAATPCTAVASRLKTAEMNRLLNGGTAASRPPAAAAPAPAATEVSPKPAPVPAQAGAKAAAPARELTSRAAIEEARKALPTLQQIDGKLFDSKGPQPRPTSNNNPSPANCARWGTAYSEIDGVGVCNTGD
jgi:hypothetical protein